MFDNLLMQTVQSQDLVTNVVAIIVAIGAIATTIGHVLSSNKRFDRQGQYMTTFGQKTVEQEGNIAAIGNAALMSNPEVKKYLEDKYGADVADLRRRAEIAEAQLRQLQPQIKPSAQADNKTDLPR